MFIKRLMLAAAACILLILPVAVAAEEIAIDAQEAQFSRMKPDIGSVFMRITNNTKTDDVLLGAEVNIRGAYAELHDVKDGNMTKVSRIAVPAGATILLRRGGLHIMLFNLPIEVKEGDEFALTLTFEKSGRKVIKVKFSGTGHNMHMH